MLKEVLRHGTYGGVEREYEGADVWWVCCSESLFHVRCSVQGLVNVREWPVGVRALVSVHVLPGEGSCGPGLQFVQDGEIELPE